MNRPIRHIAVFSGLLILALLLQTTWLQFKRTDELANHEKNTRVKIAAYAHPRGNIIVGGQPITGSVETDSTYYKYKRTFKDGAMYAPITGYSSQTYGATHLEALNNKLLSGTDDRLFLQNTLDLFTGDDRRGGDVVTTIDPKAQKAAYQGLGDRTGAVVAIDPSTGRILALASTPSYDPSVFAGSTKKDGEAWDRLQKDKRKPMDNRALKLTYAPGSTFKVITAAAALEHGLYQDINAPTKSPDPWTMPETRVPLPNQDKSAPCENASLNVAMQHSCNNVYGKVSVDLGKEKMRQTAEKFGFNDPKVDTPTRAVESVFPAEMDRPQTAMSGIGQSSVRATPLQIAMMTAAIANDGKLMKPYMVDSLRDPDLDTLEKFEPKEMSQAVSEDTAKKVQQMMEDTAEKGTGRPGRISGVTVGAKTGTAQRGVNNNLPPLAWFISYAKQGDGSPVAVAVMIDPDDSIPRDQISGGGLAGPIAKKVMQAVLKK
ncbi:penicillin-binding protein 2 [Streptomyces sp. XD-27]|uniref:peptidoglycan D,D-transpeptidase FtsI family protein n=1 Tax=Streptomyces sp. XD-27 TaxID=3062779 RepID=UPI0026F4144A|nr:penicillin-binding transpeptidase domain-containing protein [Streptomyces sp. XD-27]WKX70773.1 penicillin-binding transpeptidase domain-containing protein [Streptomyces sp. XD-27]